jgi:hypothetical protein
MSVTVWGMGVDAVSTNSNVTTRASNANLNFWVMARTSQRTLGGLLAVDIPIESDSYCRSDNDLQRSPGNQLGFEIDRSNLDGETLFSRQIADDTHNLLITHA